MPHDGDQRTLMSILTISESSPALCSASQTISSLILHRISGEWRLLPSAKRLYSTALKQARLEADNPDTDNCALIGTAHLLSLCELLQRLALDDSGTTRPHASWLIHLMETNRNDIDNPKLQRMLHSNVRLVATWELLIARNGPQIFTKSLRDKELSAGTVTSMSDLTLITSNTLEDSDRLCSEDRDCSPSHALDTIEKIISLTGTLHTWMTNYLKTLPGSPYHLIESSTLSYLTSRGTRLLFRRLYEFVDLQVQILFIGYWMCHLTLVDAHLDIVQAHEPKLDADPIEIVRLKCLANEYASHLSRSMPTLGVPYAAWAGRTMAVRPLHLLLLHYRRHKEWQKLSWCVECAHDIGVLVDKSFNQAKGVG